MEKYKLAEQDYNAGMKYKDIAKKYDVSLNTVKSWKKRYGWYRDRGAPELKSVHTKERGGASNGNKHAVGNKGGAAPRNNQNALKHGLYSKYMPDETLEIMNSMEEMSAPDLIWNQIQIQYAAIIRAQKIMWVENAEDETKVQTQAGFGDSGSDKYEYQFAWDKQANFLNAQSRAMSTLSGLIKQFIAIADEQDERKAKLNQIIASTDNIQARTALIKGAEKDTSLLNALIDVANGGDGSGSIGIQSETTRDDTATN
ncbi:TerS [Listeria monocytogenes]|uniref:phage terminase small subunit n=1 Tax=Listeria TaxID=1637 RepID=UPI0010B02274|nr:phage terminase small subunit [Listeria seeligeri]EAC5052009.1 TerS [Listeria monocytogenes]EGI1284629.1 TerS [Listeria monocytogenes]EHQ3678799.1 helix-turn-helix domain-containing protein [Listeria monocytogenes]MBF2396049.1 helix-turn-helix domain-containing protein [Listeria seeligeri]HAA6883811.1 TerS [Listeria monocytogenes]